MSRTGRLVRALLCSLLLALGLSAGVAAGAAPAGAAADNTAIAVNTKDGSSLFKFAFSVARVAGDTVDTANAAVAYASCRDCQTVAVAIQFVIVIGDPTTFTPENVAIAINENCTACDTLAAAYQFVIQVDGPVHLTHDGLKQLHDLAKQVKALEDSGLSSAELAAKIDELAHQAYDVMLHSLVPAGPPDGQVSASDESTTTSSTTPGSGSGTTSTTRATSTSTSSTSTTVRSTTTTTEAPGGTTTTTAATSE
ncbi:MAG: putative peptide zinc metalloprotease protein [Acidimicrobiaceae bacterium]|jgi:putative peptide zinc metalloprotease protein|nr:putative peptide zinc metalloprotease protein [Acidimicrobiaceae bacterium]